MKTTAAPLMKKMFVIVLLGMMTAPAFAQTPQLFGTYTLSTFGCCFAVNCADVYKLTLLKDSSYCCEHFSYSSPIRGKYWLYTLDSYDKEEYKTWQMSHDTLLLPDDDIFNFPVVFKDGQLKTGHEFYPGDKEKSSLSVLEKRKWNFLRSKRIRRKIRHHFHHKKYRY